MGVFESQAWELPIVIVSPYIASDHYSEGTLGLLGLGPLEGFRWYPILFKPEHKVPRLDTWLFGSSCDMKRNKQKH